MLSKWIEGLRPPQHSFLSALYPPLIRRGQSVPTTSPPLAPFSHLHFKFPTAADVEVRSNFQSTASLHSHEPSLFASLSLTPTPMATREGTTSSNAPTPEAARRPLLLTRFALSSAQVTHGRRSWPAAGRGPKSASSTAGAGPGSRPPRGTWRRKPPPLAARPPCRRPFAPLLGSADCV
jgi:hypothetical protein